VRRLLTWAVVSLGVAALARRLRQRRSAQDAVAEQEQGVAVEPDADDDPADELRRKLAESRAEEEPAEPPVSEPATVEERRAEVHEQGRSALDEMREPGAS
jgi:hypothetical protein